MLSPIDDIIQAPSFASPAIFRRDQPPNGAMIEAARRHVSPPEQHGLAETRLAHSSRIGSPAIIEP
jgi:hypothetical protein